MQLKPKIDLIFFNKESLDIFILPSFDRSRGEGIVLAIAPGISKQSVRREGKKHRKYVNLCRFARFQALKNQQNKSNRIFDNSETILLNAMNHNDDIFRRRRYIQTWLREKTDVFHHVVKIPAARSRKWRESLN